MTSSWYLVMFKKSPQPSRTVDAHRTVLSHQARVLSGHEHQAVVTDILHPDVEVGVASQSLLYCLTIEVSTDHNLPRVRCTENIPAQSDSGRRPCSVLAVLRPGSTL